MFSGLAQPAFQKAARKWIRLAFQKARSEIDPYKRAYLLSMPLLVSVQLRETAQHPLITSWMDQALLAMTPDQNSRKAWLSGRYLKAKMAMRSPEVNTFAGELRALLDHPNTTIDAYSAWGWGYLAMHGESYTQAKTPMMQSAFYNTQRYLTHKADKIKLGESKDLAEELSSLLWVRVVHLQAAADAGDKETYQIILRNIQLVAYKGSVVEALLAGIPDADYQAWALSMVYSSAKKMGDVALCHAVLPALCASMQRAEKGGEPLAAAFMLAQCDMLSAENRMAVQQDYAPAFLPSAL